MLKLYLGSVGHNDSSGNNTSYYCQIMGQHEKLIAE